MPGGQRHDHRTGRVCEKQGCAGELVDSVVLFGESMPLKVREERQVALNEQLQQSDTWFAFRGRSMGESCRGGGSDSFSPNALFACSDVRHLCLRLL